MQMPANSWDGRLTRTVDLLDAVRPALRLEILLGIGRRPSCVSDLAKRHELDRTVVCKHLCVLRRLELVRFSQKAHNRVYSLGERVHVRWAESEVDLVLYATDRGQISLRIPTLTLRSTSPWLLD